MDRYLAFFAILAIFVTGTESVPVSDQDSTDLEICENWRTAPGFHVYSIINPINCTDGQRTYARTYYQCQANGARRGGYEAILKHCAAGTAFDPKSGICNHVSSLSCEKEPSQSVDPFELREGKVYLEPDDSETEPEPQDSKPEPDIDCDLQFNTHIKKLTKHVKKSQWIFPEDDVKSLKNNDKTGKCCWDVYTSMDSKYDKTTLMPGSACDTDMKVDHYLEKKLCSLQIQQIFELMGK
jgi:hypothetical protein